MTTGTLTTSDPSSLGEVTALYKLYENGVECGGGRAGVLFLWRTQHLSGKAEPDAAWARRSYAGRGSQPRGVTAAEGGVEVRRSDSGGVPTRNGSLSKRRGEPPAGHTAAAPESGVGHQASSPGKASGGETPPVGGPKEGTETPTTTNPGRTLVHGPRTPRLKAHSLIDKVYNWDNLVRAWRRVRRNKGTHGLDRVTIRHFEADWKTHLREIQRKLKQRRYEPQPVRRVYIPKESNPKKKRPLGIPVVADRVVGQALLLVLDPLFDAQMSQRSFGFRRGRKAHDAVATLIRDGKEGYRYVVDADIASFFDRLDHQVVMSRLRARIADGRILDLFEAFLKAGIHEGGIVYVPTEGTPQGGVISPWIANLVLDDLDWAIEARGWRLVRYADDFVVLCQSLKQAQEALRFIKQVLEELKLSLNEDKTSLTDFREGFEFLGFRLRSYRLGIRPSSIERFKDKVRRVTRRQQGRNVDAVIADLNPILRGYGRYFGVAEVAAQFAKMDTWTRMRIRSFKTKRRCRNDNWRIPNRRLAKWNLLSLQECRSKTRLSYMRV